MSDFSFWALLISTLAGFGSLFGFLRILWKDLFSELRLLRGEFHGLESSFEIFRTEMRSEVRSDLYGFRTEMKSDMQDLRTEMKSDMQDLRTEMKSDMQDLRTEVKSDIRELRAEMKTEFQNFDNRFQESIQRLERRIDVTDGSILDLRNRVDILVDSIALRFLEDLTRTKRRFQS
ncbi:DUF1640 domain-containing protein [Leptospira ellisii]|uniref:DUF1640 domain-containing protein n=1 Tax=Leptospira ellisii TaxID=2023197 RepID=A0A2N0B8Y4_9LEPT|nr:coiled-coil domain-containing protein [Leptospira ellisii]MDV6234911.1 DUF1640 domain-containing protein [Leptospira ellisii]PJZ92986.1 hypothetical protein CH379_10260 [Leptospira ellisii]